MTESSSKRSRTSRSWRSRLPPFAATPTCPSSSKAFIEDGQTLAEGYPLRVARRIHEMGADVVGANCVVGPQRMYDVVRWMARGGDFPILAMPTPGLPQTVGKEVLYDTTPEYFGRAAARLADAGANLIGGCCGILPA
ncbi:MAG: hypothetical protein C4341_04640, partial [Armatimonadota bacterium]